MYNRKLIISEEEKKNILNLHESKKKQELGLITEANYGTNIGFTKGISDKDFKELVCSLVKPKYGFSVKNGKIFQSNTPYMYMSSPVTDPTDGKKWNQLMAIPGFYNATPQNDIRNVSILTWLGKADPSGSWQKYAIECMSQQSKDIGGGGQRPLTVPTMDQVKDCKNKLSFRQGMKGQTIKQIQGLLGSKYANLLGPVNNTTKQYDGIFGPKTAQAVKQFQTDNGLKSDGVVGCNTMNKMIQTLQSSIQSQKPAETPKTAPNPDLAVGNQSSAVNLTQGNQSALANIGTQPGIGLQ